MVDVSTTNLSEKNTMEGSTLNSPPKIIITKENIGLEEHQHQQYQFKLFNSMLKSDQYYEDLSKFKDRLEKTVPNMQQVIHIDMKRVRTNKIYERKLIYDLNGPRGLHWQFKNKLHRLQCDERDVERDLKRLNRDLAKIALSPSIARTPSGDQNRDLSRSQTPHLPPIDTSNSSVASPQKSATLLGRSFSINTGRNTVTRLKSMSSIRSSINKSNYYNEKSPWVRNQNISKTNEIRPYLQEHANTINRQKREIEQKLREFLH